MQINDGGKDQVEKKKKSFSSFPFAVRIICFTNCIFVWNMIENVIVNRLAGIDIVSKFF